MIDVVVIVKIFFCFFFSIRRLHTISVSAFLLNHSSDLPDVAALVQTMTADEVTFVLVNTNQVQSRTVVVQAGGYAEHQFASVAADGRVVDVNAPCFTVRLAPGAGSRFQIKMRRYANQPTLAFPWERSWKLN